MSRLIFVADVHLCQEQPAATAGFLNFLAIQATNCDALYILGDLFEAWIGDDDPNPLHQQVAQAIAKLTCPVYFIHGNRDFLLGENFAQRCNMTLLPDTFVLMHEGKRAVILHGDTLCTDDQGYQKYRSLVHKPWIQKIFRCLPLAWRLRIATKMRSDSQQANQFKSQAIMDVNATAVQQLVNSSQVNFMIHGHTHRPALHQIEVDETLVVRGVLGAWHEKGWIIQWDEQGLTLLDFPW